MVEHLQLDARELLLGVVDQKLLSAAETETAPSIPWFAAIQGFKSKKDLAGLAPKGGFVPAEAIERVVTQIGETQKATRELNGRIDSSLDGVLVGAVNVFSIVRATVQCWIGVVEAGRVSATEQGVDNLSLSLRELGGAA